MVGSRHRTGASLTRIGLLGGSFNPAHGAHRAISLKAMEALGLDEVWWLVSPGNPLKSATDMAPLAVRYASALRQSRRARIRPSAMEREFSTRYTVDTLSAIVRRWPKRQFIWLMGADNLVQFHRWREWRRIARMVPIAVVARPGYDGLANASLAMVWLGRYRRSIATMKNPARWSAPALVILRFDPDPRSATAIRQADPHWVDRLDTRSLRDAVTHRAISSQEPTSPK